MAAKHAVMVSVDRARRGEIDRIAEELEHRGMKVDQVHRLSGVITGESETDSNALQSVDGVVAVEDQAMNYPV